MISKPPLKTILLAASLVAATLAAQEAGPGYQLTEEVREFALQAQQAIAINGFAAASNHLAQASGLAQTDGDRYLIATLQLDIANRTFNQGGQLAAIDRLIASPLVGEEQRQELLYHRGRITYHAQDKDAARSALRDAINRGSGDPRTYIALAGLESDERNWTGALQLYESAARLMNQAGQTIPEPWYRRAIDLAQRTGNIARANEIGQELLAAYPSARNWRDMLAFYRDTANPDPLARLDSWRLQEAAGALYGESDYLAFAELANSAEQPADIVRIVGQGRAANTLDGENAEINALLRNAERAKTSAEAWLDARATAAEAAATGAEARLVGDDYLGFGNYARAAALYRTALEKGGADPSLVNSRLGIALARIGDVEGARTAFAQVQGDRSWIANFWRIYAEKLPPRPAAPVAQSPAAAETAPAASVTDGDASVGPVDPGS